MGHINRREALLRLGGLVAGASLADLAGRAAAQTTGTAATATPAEPLTIAHITDVHLTNERNAEEWTAKCLQHMQSQAVKPAIVINTGDTVYDTVKQSRSEADFQWKLWNDTYRRECNLPMYTCLGNHDVWGLKAPGDIPMAADPKFGKLLAQEQLGLEKLYYSFDKGGWHFVMLDSIFPLKGSTWMGLLDEEQFHWLEQDLKATPADRPVLVGSHMPILQMCTMASQRPEEDRHYDLNAGVMMGDARRLIDLFKKHPNVKLCLSGHIHRLDRVELSGVTYICDGAVCGQKWWPMEPHTSVPGYSLTTLHPDGKFDYAYHDFGWQYKA